MYRNKNFINFFNNHINKKMKYVGRVLLNSYLKKRSNILHMWNTRLCVLTENYLITYKQK